MSNRDFWKIVLFSSFISAGVVFFFLRWPSPPSTQAEFGQSSGATFDTALTEDESINIRIYESQSRGVVNITSTTLEYTWFLKWCPVRAWGAVLSSIKKGIS